MNFYYDPILGLQYTVLCFMLIVDIKDIPKDLNLEEFYKKWHYFNEELGINLCNAQRYFEITNYNL